MQSKAACRKSCEQKLRQIEPHKQELDRKISKNLEALLAQLFSSSDKLTLGIYKPLADEPAVDISMPVTFSYPKVSGDTDMHFYRSEKFSKGAFAIDEPVNSDDCNLVPKDQHDAFVIPGLAFLQQGSRLGRGKGYFDRYLKLVDSVKIGVGYSCVIQGEQWLPEKHDVPMNYVVTDKFILKVV